MNKTLTWSFSHIRESFPASSLCSGEPLNGLALTGDANQNVINSLDKVWQQWKGEDGNGLKPVLQVKLHNFISFQRNVTKVRWAKTQVLSGCDSVNISVIAPTLPKLLKVEPEGSNFLSIRNGYNSPYPGSITIKLHAQSVNFYSRFPVKGGSESWFH